MTATQTSLVERTMITSSIVVPEATAKRIQDTVLEAEENALKKRSRYEAQDDEQRKRGQRLFGVLTGTLKKFKTEQNEDANRQRAELELKLQERLAKEREALKERMIREQRERKLKILQRRRDFETKIKARLFETWKRQETQTANFLKTKTQPSLCYAPVKLTTEEEELIKVQQDKVVVQIQAKSEERLKEKERWDMLIEQATLDALVGVGVDTSPTAALEGESKQSQIVAVDQSPLPEMGHTFAEDLGLSEGEEEREVVVVTALEEDVVMDAVEAAVTSD